MNDNLHQLVTFIEEVEETSSLAADAHGASVTRTSSERLGLFGDMVHHQGRLEGLKEAYRIMTGDDWDGR